MEWYDSHLDLTDEQVLASWQEERPGKEDPDSPFEEKVLMRPTAMKAKMRASLWAITYQKETMEMPDIRATMRAWEEALSKNKGTSTP